MKSMETLLAESLGEMDVLQKDKFFKKRKAGSPIEAQVNLAQEIVKEGPGRRKINRNNGATRVLTEAERGESAMLECDRILFEGMAKARPTNSGQLAKVVTEAAAIDALSEAERTDYDFLIAIGHSEADALKTAKVFRA